MSLGMKGIQNLMVLIMLFGLHLFTFIWTFVMLGSLKFDRTYAKRILMEGERSS
jgi:hypothetical protein